MANIKISALPAAAALTGTEAVPVVQSGVTVKTTAAAIAATGTTPTLNLVTTAGNSTTPSIVFKASGSGSTAYVSNSTGNWLSLNGVAEVVPAGGIAPVTTNTYVLGSTSFRWAKLWSYDADLSGALAVSGNVTPALLTASKPVFTDASKNLVSTGTLAYDQGGTGQTTYAAGDIVYASATNTLTKLAIGTNGQVLKVTAGLLPAWDTDSAGTGTVTSASVVSANGFAGTVATATTTPAITLTTSITGLLKGNATAISAATAATDYVAPSSYASANGLTMATARILGRTTASTGAAEEITIGSGLSMTAGTLISTGSGGSVTTVGWTGGIVTVANQTTTPAFTIAGTSGGVPYFNSGTTWDTSAALAANSLVIGGGAGLAPSTTTTGTGVLTFLGTPSSANLAAAVTDETGSGALVFATSPTLATSVDSGATFTAFAGATTSLTLGGTGATSVLAVPGTLEQSSTTGALTVAGGVYIAKKLTAVGAAATGALTVTGAVTATGGIDKLTSATGVVSVAAATAPSTGQVLMATNATTATWQTPSSGVTQAKATAIAMIFGF